MYLVFLTTNLLHLFDLLIVLMRMVLNQKIVFYCLPQIYNQGLRIFYPYFQYFLIRVVLLHEDLLIMNCFRNVNRVRGKPLPTLLTLSNGISAMESINNLFKPVYLSLYLMINPVITC